MGLIPQMRLALECWYIRSYRACATKHSLIHKENRCVAFLEISVDIIASTSLFVRFKEEFDLLVFLYGGVLTSGSDQSLQWNLGEND